MIHSMALPFICSFIFIWLRAFQTRNIAFDNYGWIVPMSVAMGFVEVYLIANVARQGYSIPLVLSMGVGGGLGALSAAMTHKKFLTKGNHGKASKEPRT